LQSVATILLIR